MLSLWEKVKKFVIMLIDADLLPLKKRADEGDLNAQYKMAWVFLLGKGARKDNLLGIKYLKKVIKRSHLELSHLNYEVLLLTIGSAYAEIGLTDKAIKWYKNTLWFLIEYCTEEYKDLQVAEYNLKHLIKTGKTTWDENLKIC